MGAGAPVGGAPAAGTPGPEIEPSDVFGPTTMPNQPITAGVSGPQGAPPDPDMVLRELALAFPTPWILRLLRNRG